LLRLKDDLLAGEDRLVEFPRIWIIALSKADLFPDWDVHSFRDLVIWNAAEHIEPAGGASLGVLWLLPSPLRKLRTAAKQHPAANAGPNPGQGHLA
jgi:hypothetical protein